MNRMSFIEAIKSFNPTRAVSKIRRSPRLAAKVKDNSRSASIEAHDLIASDTSSAISVAASNEGPHSSASALTYTVSPAGPSSVTLFDSNEEGIKDEKDTTTKMTASLSADAPVNSVIFYKGPNADGTSSASEDVLSRCDSLNSSLVTEKILVDTSSAISVAASDGGPHTPVSASTSTVSPAPSSVTLFDLHDEDGKDVKDTTTKIPAYGFADAQTNSVIFYESPDADGTSSTSEGVLSRYNHIDPALVTQEKLKETLTNTLPARTSKKRASSKSSEVFVRRTRAKHDHSTSSAPVIVTPPAPAKVILPALKSKKLKRSRDEANLDEEFDCPARRTRARLAATSASSAEDMEFDSPVHRTRARAPLSAASSPSSRRAVPAGKGSKSRG